MIKNMLTLDPKTRYSLDLSLLHYDGSEHAHSQKSIIISQKVGNEFLRDPLDFKLKPKNLSSCESILWEASKEDFEWSRKFFFNVPDYLGLYFARRYATLSKEKSRKSANTYLRTSLGGNIKNRLLKVNQHYFENKASTLIVNYVQEFEQLPTYGREKIRTLADSIAKYFMRYIYDLIDGIDSFKLKEHLIKKTSLEYRIYQVLINELAPIKLVPPYFADYKNDKLTSDKIVIAFAKVGNEDWWFNKLKRRRDLHAEHLAIACGQVQKKASAYVSNKCLSEWREQKRKNKEFIDAMSLENEATGEQMPLNLMVHKSNANPAIRRCELMVRMRGFEDLAEHYGYQGVFITLTAPSKYHSVHSKGGFVQNWMGNNPRETQAYLCKIWSQIRAKLNREEIRIFGFRVAEPHHDGTPHWHILLFMLPENLTRAKEIVQEYALREDGHEPGAQQNRFEFKLIDPEKGSATGYIAKYISKNIDGYALDDDVDNETGENLKQMAKAVTAWASRWRIRQFQQIGGAPVSVWRELRRLGDKAVEDQNIDPVLACADVGDWAAYTDQQGGPTVARKDLKVRISYEENTNQFTEVVKKIKGVFSPITGKSSFICTRLIKWLIVKTKVKSKGDQTNSHGNAVPWSSVNNCTQNSPDFVDDQWEQIRKQLKIIGIPDDDHSISKLYRHESLKINQNQYLYLGNALNGVHLIVDSKPKLIKKSPKNSDFEMDF